MAPGSDSGPSLGNPHSLIVPESRPCFVSHWGRLRELVIIIAKEDYVYARALITIQPDGLNQSVSVTFPNGTSTTIEGLRTESIVLPNTIYYTFVDVGTSGEGYSVYGNHPLDVTFLSGQNATNFLTYNSSLVPAKGIHVFYLVIDGSAMVSVRVLGVSL